MVTPGTTRPALSTHNPALLDALLLRKGLVRVGPLTAGRYDFFGDFNQDTAKGVLIAE